MMKESGVDFPIIALDWNIYLHYCFVIAFLLALLLVKSFVCTTTKGLFVENEEANKNDRLLTRIHNKWYDLSEFNHPGGPVALSLAKGRDATALFESHHYFIPRKRLLKLLSKFEVSQEEAATLSTLDKRDDGSPYDWNGIDEDGFASDLRELVVDYFSSVEATKATSKRWLVIWLFLGSFFASLPAFTRGSWVFIVVTPILAWLAIVNYWHDSLHFALSTNWKTNAYLPYLLPLLSSPWMWYHHHVIGHQ